LIIGVGGCVWAQKKPVVMTGNLCPDWLFLTLRFWLAAYRGNAIKGLLHDLAQEPGHGHTEILGRKIEPSD
jgi:hypothetical protein